MMGMVFLDCSCQGDTADGSNAEDVPPLPGEPGLRSLWLSCPQLLSSVRAWSDRPGSWQMVALLINAGDTCVHVYT